MVAISTLSEKLLNPILRRMGRYVAQLPNLTDVVETFELLRPVKCHDGLIRVGSDADGGYLIPKNLALPEALISPGVADDSTFELFFAEQGVPCILVDASVPGPPVQHPNFSFRKEWVGSDSSEKDVVTLTELVSSLGTLHVNSNLALQMDIEGAEYEVLLATPTDDLSKFQLIVLELHGLDGVSNSIGLSMIRKVLRKLSMHHDVVHFHPNNCCGEFQIGPIRFPRVAEITLVRRDLGLTSMEFAELPHVLDVPNDRSRKVLNVSWLFRE